jgi:HEAT repeat protein
MAVRFPLSAFGKAVLLIVSVCLASSWLAFAAVKPQLRSGKLVEQASSGDLAKDVAAISGPAWVGYSVPVIPGEHHMCCWNSYNEFRANSNCCGGCNLERKDGGSFIGDKLSDCHLEAASEFFVLMRVQGGNVEKIRPFSADCGLDAGGLTVYWLNGVTADQSITFLSRFAEQGTGSKKQEDESVVAIALHNSPAADAMLERLMSPGQSEHSREQASFWLASTRGRKGFELVRAALRNDNDAHFLEHATFALSTSKEPDAQDELMRLARNDSRPKVREQAIFWLAQKAGQRVSKTITDAIENDPDTDVKKKAVFALSQMPESEGVPLLIKTAENNRNPVVRKEAIFWLGQSGDPRALDFIESVLRR